MLLASSFVGAYGFEMAYLLAVVASLVLVKAVFGAVIVSSAAPAVSRTHESHGRPPPLLIPPSVPAWCSVLLQFALDFFCEKVDLS